MSGDATFVVEESSPVYNIRHRAFYFSKNVIEFVGVTNYDRIYYSLFDQLLRAATSVGANLVEAVLAFQTEIILIIMQLLSSRRMKQNTGFALLKKETFRIKVNWMS
jgi:hypothetical protein